MIIQTRLNGEEAVINSASYAGQALSASYAKTASVAQTWQASLAPQYYMDAFGSAELQDLGLGNTSETYLTQDQITTPNIVATSVTASLNGNADTATSASYADTINPVQTMSLVLTDNSNIATLTIQGSGNTGGGSSTIQSIPAGLVLNANAYLGKIYFDNDVIMAPHTITANMLFGSASYANTASLARTASSALNVGNLSLQAGGLMQITSSDAVGIQSLGNHIFLAADGNIYLSAGLDGDGVYLSDTTELVAGKITATDIAADSYQLLPSYYIEHDAASYTITDYDNGKLLIFTGSAVQTVTLRTSGIDSAWSAMFYQSGSGPIVFATASNSTILRNRSSSTGSAGQYAMVSVIRMPSGDFVLMGDTA